VAETRLPVRRSMTAEMRAPWNSGLVEARRLSFSWRRVELRPERWRRLAGMLSKEMLKTVTMESTAATGTSRDRASSTPRVLIRACAGRRLK
jgi:hypothetical protein